MNHVLRLSACALALASFSWSAQAQNSTFSVGALTPVTGAGAPYGGGMSKAIEMALAEINTAGGAKGAKLVLASEDSQSAPQAAVLGAKKLISVSGARAVIGVWSSGESLAVIPLTNEANVLLMHASGAPALSGAPVNEKKLGFRFQATNGRFGRAFAEIAKRQGYTKPATMAFNNASGLGNTEGFAAAWKATQGKDVVASVVYEPNRPSYRSELQSVLRAKPDVIVTGSYLADTTIILREWYQSGVDTKWIIPGWAANSDLIKALGPQVTEGIISVETVSNETAPSFKHYADAAQRRASTFRATRMPPWPTTRPSSSAWQSRRWARTPAARIWRRRCTRSARPAARRSTRSPRARKSLRQVGVSATSARPAR